MELAHMGGSEQESTTQHSLNLSCHDCRYQPNFLAIWANDLQGIFQLHSPSLTPEEMSREPLSDWMREGEWRLISYNIISTISKWRWPEDIFFFQKTHSLLPLKGHTNMKNLSRVPAVYENKGHMTPSPVFENAIIRCCSGFFLSQFD